MHRSRVLSLLALFLFTSPCIAQEVAPLFTTDFPPQEFAARRNKVFDQIGPDAVVLLQGEPTQRGYTRFRQSNEFYYLTGIEVPHAYLLMDGRSRRSTLFLPHVDAPRDAREGKLLSAEDTELVPRLTGIERVAGPEAISGQLGGLMRRNAEMTLYTQFIPSEGVAESRDLAIRRATDRAGDPWDGRLSREAHFVSLIKSRFPGFDVRNISPILDQLRLVKSENELTLIRRATRLSGLGLMESMRSLEPGQKESELDAVAKFLYWRNGAQGDAYYSLVADGKNAYSPHYHAGASTVVDGDLLLMDYAPDYSYYMSDLTRMMPVNGTFSKGQSELYGFYVRCYRAMLDHIRVGVTAQQIKQEALVVMDETFSNWTFSKDIYRKAAKDFVESYRRGAQSATTRMGHWVGMATHDVGNWTGPLKEGMVFTIEPALRVPEETIYIRNEDLIIITADGAEIVSDFVPLEIADIEKLMREEGILQKYPKD